VVLDLSSWKPMTGEDVANYSRGLMGKHGAGKFRAGVLELAVQNLLNAGGRPFRPSPAEIIDEAVRVQWPALSPVAWTEVWTSINAARRHIDFPRNEKRITVAAQWVGERVAGELGPVAGGFAAATFADIQHAPVSGGERSGAAVGALRKEWDAYQQVVRDRVLRGGPVLTPAEIVSRGERTSPLPAAALELEQAA
jgi:hypothetical protein